MVREAVIGAMMVASTTAWAEPTTTRLQIRLHVVEGCSDGSDGRSASCAVPRQRSDAPNLPEQVRALAPPADTDDNPPAGEPLTTYY